jgi:predicted transport protein
MGRESQLELISTHISKASPDLRQVYDKLESQILALGPDVKRIGRKHYVGFSRKKNFVDIVVYPLQLNLYLNMKKGSLKDPKKLALDVSQKAHWGGGDYVVLVRDSQHLEYVVNLIKQSYRRN